MKRGFLAVLVAALPAVALAQTYKWKDEYGQVHFTQIPPKNGTYEVVGPAPPPSDAPNQESLNKSLQDAVKAQPEQQKAADAAAQQQAQRQELCKSALERMAYLDAHPSRRMATADAQGNVSRMTPEEHDRQRAAEQEKANKYCD